MSRTVSLLLVSLVFVAGAAAQSVSGDRPTCVHASAASRWNAGGYNHNVTVTNGCDYAVRCTVSTDVNPSPQGLDLAAGEERFLTTWFDAPAPAFVATVTCAR
jgi:hypothetical protein